MWQRQGGEKVLPIVLFKWAYVVTSNQLGSTRRTWCLYTHCMSRLWSQTRRPAPHCAWSPFRGPTLLLYWFVQLEIVCFSLDPSPLKFVQSYMELVFSALTFVLFCLCVRFCGWVCGSVCVSVRERETLIFNLSVCLHPILCVHSPGVDVFQPCGDRWWLHRSAAFVQSQEPAGQN